MKRNAGYIAVALCVVGVAGILSYAFLRAGGAAAQALPAAGKFKVGSALGHERAGFSGLPLAQVFVSAGDPSWPALAACLQSAEVEAELGSFTPVLVDVTAEPDVELTMREYNGLQVVVRGINGAILGGLPAEFTCADLLELLQSIRGTIPEGSIERSPIYASLLESPDAIDSLKAEGEAAKAARFVELLKEFEGDESPAALAAQARLNR